MNIVAPPKISKFSWKREILDLKEGEKFTAPYKHWTTIRPRISEIKREYPERNYTTEKILINNEYFLIVTRDKDEEIPKTSRKAK